MNFSTTFKKLYCNIIAFVITISYIFAQPAVFHTNLTSSTNPALSNSRLTLNDLGAFRQVRFQTTATPAPAPQTYAFHAGTTGTPDYSTCWRPYNTSDATITPYTLNTVSVVGSIANTARHNTSGGGVDGNLSALANNTYYTVNIQENPTANNLSAIWATSYNPVNIINVIQSPAMAQVTATDPVKVTVTTNLAPASGENMFVRYTTNNFATSAIVQLSFTGVTGRATIPAQPLSTNVKYYIFSSSRTSAQLATIVGTANILQNGYDMATLNLNHNLGLYYSYTVVPPQPFITEWITNDGTIIIPTYPFGGILYNYDISYRQVLPTVSGYTTVTGRTGDYTITGLTNGNTYEISISGAFPRIYFATNADINRNKIINIKQWGSMKWISMAMAFESCKNINSNATDVPNLNNVTDLSTMFQNCLNFNGNIGNWNTSTITDMSYMFDGAEAFNQNIGNWNTSAVTKMNAMFYAAKAFNQNIGGWNTSLVNDMAVMFVNAKNFNQNIGNWNTGAVTSMIAMFANATNFNGDIGNWNTSAVTDMTSMFLSAENFNQNIGNWNTSKVTNMRSMFYSAHSFNQNIGNWNTSKVTNMSFMFADAFVFNQNIEGWDTSKVTNMMFMFTDAFMFNQNIGSWDITKLEPSYDGAYQMLSNSGINKLNYDNILIGWASQNVQQGVFLGASGLKYCMGASARAALINNKNWVITDDALACPQVSDVRGIMTNFNGNGQNLRTLNNIDISGNTNRTLETWFKVNNISGTQFIASWGSVTSSNNAFGLYLNNGTLRFYAFGANDYDINTNIIADTWYHLAITYDGTTIIPYINGIIQPTRNIILNTTNSPLFMGSDVSNANYLNGSLEEVRIWNVVRSQNQIRENMHLTLASTEIGLVSYYQFNENTGEAIDGINGKNASFFGGVRRSASEVPVSGGTSQRMNVNNGLNTFTNANVAVNFINAPNDEFVAYQLRGNPYNDINSSNLGTNTASCYWIIRQFGMGNVAYNNINFIIPNTNTISVIDETNPNNLKLYKRPDNATTDFPSFFASATNANNTNKIIQFTGFATQTSFSQFQIGTKNESPLPTDMLALEGTRTDENNILLYWKTVTEFNNKGFDVEMSENNNVFNKIGFVDGAGYSTTIKNYEFPFINPNGAYYRLKQIDLNGSFSYSNVVFIEAPQKDIIVYPNPTTDNIYIKIPQQGFSYRIVSMQGSILAEGSTKGNSAQIDIQHFANSVYILQITGDFTTKTLKILVKK